MKKLIILTILAGLLFVRQIGVYGAVDKITICHATGLAGTDHFVTLELPYPAVYGQGGHFNENGTTQAGHEEDYLGPCTTPTQAVTPTVVQPTIIICDGQCVTPTVGPTDSVPTPTREIPTPSITGVQPTSVIATGVPPTGTPSNENKPAENKPSDNFPNSSFDQKQVGWK